MDISYFHCRIPDFHHTLYCNWQRFQLHENDIHISRNTCSIDSSFKGRRICLQKHSEEQDIIPDISCYHLCTIAFIPCPNHKFNYKIDMIPQEHTLKNRNTSLYNASKRKLHKLL